MPKTNLNLNNNVFCIPLLSGRLQCYKLEIFVFYCIIYLLFKYPSYKEYFPIITKQGTISPKKKTLLYYA